MIIGYVNRRSHCCHTAVPVGTMGYVNKRSCCCHTTVSGKMIGYVNKRSCCCHTAIPGGALESSRRAQLTECRMRKSRLVG